MPYRNKKLVGAHTLSDEDKEQAIVKGCALIRANFHIDPHGLTYEQWADMFTQACWLERTRLVNLATVLSKLFSTTDTR